MKNILTEFKEFAVKGNAIDLAVGIIIGAGFNAIVSALVDEVIMPPLSLLVGNVDLTQKAVVLREAAESSESITLGYGVLLNAVIEFVLIAFVIFMVVRYINKLKRDEPKSTEKPARKCPYCKQPVEDEATRCPHCTAELSADNT